MNADKALTVFRELTVGRSRLNVKVSYWGQADADVRPHSYQIEIQTPLPPGTRDWLLEIQKRYNLTDIRLPVRYSTGKGKLILS